MVMVMDTMDRSGGVVARRRFGRRIGHGGRSCGRREACAGHLQEAMGWGAAAAGDGRDLGAHIPPGHRLRRRPFGRRYVCRGVSHLRIRDPHLNHYLALNLPLVIAVVVILLHYPIRIHICGLIKTHTHTHTPTPHHTPEIKTDTE